MAGRLVLAAGKNETSVCSPCGSGHRAAGVSSQHGSWLPPDRVIEERKVETFFYDLGLEVIHHYFCMFCWWHRSVLIQYTYIHTYT